MPVYEYRCGACKKKFSLVMSVEEKEKKRVRCPKCNSPKTERVLGTFFAKTSRKS